MAKAVAGKGKKACPECGEIIGARSSVCPKCSHQFTPKAKKPASVSTGFDTREAIRLIKEAGGVAKVEKLIEAVRKADEALAMFGGMESAAEAVAEVKELEELLKAK